MNQKEEEIDVKIEELKNNKILEEYTDAILDNLDLRDRCSNIKFTIFLPYPEITYSLFGVGLSSNYKKHINCQRFIEKMFGRKIIGNLLYKKYDVSFFNYERLNGIKHYNIENETYKNEEKFKRPDKNIYENEGKMQKEKYMRALFKQYTNPEQKQEIDNINNKTKLNNDNKLILKKSIRLQKSNKKNRDFYNIMINLSRKELDSLLISPKLKKNLLSKLQKKLLKKTKLQTFKNYFKSIKKGKKSKNINNRPTKIRKRIMISQLKEYYPNEPNIRTINSNNITIKKLSNIYKKHFKNRYEMIKKLKNKDKNNLIKYINYDNFTHNNLNNMSYDKLNNLYKKIYTTNSPFNTNESVISKTKKKLKNIKSSYFTK